MKRIILSVVFGVVAEGSLCALFASFGEMATPGGGHTNLLGWVTLYFHLPGLFLSHTLLGGVFDNLLEITVIILSGAVQWFLLSWLFIVVWERLRRKYAA